MRLVYLFLFIIITITFLSGQSQNKREVDEKLKLLCQSFSKTGPQLFGAGKISTPLIDWGMTISSDGEEIYYTVTGKGKMAIVCAKYESGKWSDPEVVPFSGKYKDATPNISRDGKRIVFASRRPTHPADTLFDNNFWQVERHDGIWGKPHPIDAINTGVNEFFPSMGTNGDLYFCARYDGNKNPVHIYMSKYINGSYQKPEQVEGEINTKYGEYCPYISPDGSFMIVEIVNAPDGYGKGDMYISFKKSDGTWGKPQNLGKEINSEEHDCYPIISPDGNYLIYMSCRKPVFNNNGNSTFNDLLWESSGLTDDPFDFYWVDAEILNDF